MLTVQDIPTIWVDILKKIQTIDPSAVIAGGALRDLDNKRQVKDLDIVVANKISFFSLTEVLGVDFDDVDITSVESAGQDANFVSECTFRVEGLDIPVNVVESLPALSPIEKTKQNDFGICQIWFTGTSLASTSLYEMDCGYEKMTLARCNNLNEWNAIQKHYLRLVKKYEWPIVIPAKFATLILYDGDPFSLKMW